MNINKYIQQSNICESDLLTKFKLERSTKWETYQDQVDLKGGN